MSILSKKLSAIIAVSAITFSSVSFNANAINVTSETITSVCDENNWDEVLNSYEQYVDQYVKTMKKVKEGDPTAIASYAKLLAQAQKLQKKLDNASEEMSEEQLSRYAKITAKLTKALN